MSTKRVTTVEEVDAAEEAELIEVIEDDEDVNAELDALEGMISEFSGAADTVVNVYRQGEGKNLSFLFRTNPGEMTGGEIMERCRDNYGTGDYRIHIRQGPRLRANKPFSVEAKKIEENAPQNGGLDTMAFITMMQENSRQNMQMFSEAMKAFAANQNNAPSFDPVAMQAANMQTIAALKKLSEPQDVSGKAVDMLVQGITLAKDLQPKDGETNTSDILLQALKTFGEPLANAANQIQANQGTPGNGAALPPPGDQQAASDAEREREMGLRKMMLKQQLGFLVQNAAAGKNPELYAELLLDQIGEERVLEFVGKPDAMDQLVAIDPNVEQFRPWFEALRAHILELTGGAGHSDPMGEPPAMYQSVIIPGADQSDAIPDADDNGDVTGVTAGASGDAPNA